MKKKKKLYAIFLENYYNFDNIMEELVDILKSDGDIWKVIDKLRLITNYTDREYISINSKSRVVYFDEEVTKCQKDEESILYDIIPPDFTINNISDLNILNIGAGGRTIHNSLICVDFNRGLENLDHNGVTKNCILSYCNDLPFKNNSMDGIIALHIFEHVSDPVSTLVEWLRVIKPGARIGIVVPNFKYNWSASTDGDKYGHRWNTEPDIFKKLLNTHFKDIINIIKFDTLDMKLSFNVVIEKKGLYIPFKLSHEKTGYELDNGIHKDVGYYYHNNNIYK